MIVIKRETILTAECKGVVQLLGSMDQSRTLGTTSLHLAVENGLSFSCPISSFLLICRYQILLFNCF